MNKKILYILSIVVTFGLMSCDKYLDTTPDNRTVLDSDEKVKELLTSAYPEMTYGLFCYSMSDNVADRGEGNEVFRNNEQGYFWKSLPKPCRILHQVIGSLATMPLPMPTRLWSLLKAPKWRGTFLLSICLITEKHFW